MPTIPFREWLPDQPDLNNPGLVDAKNVYRRNRAYHPQHDIEFPGGNQSEDLGIASTRNALRAASASESGVEFYGIAATNGSATIDLLAHESGVSLVSSTTIASTSSVVSDFVNFNGDLYYFARDSKQYKSVRGGAFTLVSSSTQFGATSAARVGQFIITGFRFGIKWSGFNMPEDWDVSRRTMAGESPVNQPELGMITGILGGRTNYIFQEFGVSRLTYVGPKKVWDIQPISIRYGATKGTPVDVGGVVYFIGASGSDDAASAGAGALHVLKSNGSQVVDISDGRVADWLSDNFDTTGADGMRCGVYDAPRRRVIWSSGVGGGTHKFLCMSVDTEEFSYFEGDYHLLIPGPFHHEDNGGALVGVAENSSNLHYGPFTGDALEATLTTGHMTGEKNRFRADQPEPYYSGSGATVAMSGKNLLRSAPDFGEYVAETAATGVHDVHAEGRAVATSVKFPAGAVWSDFASVAVDARGSGRK